MSPDRLWSFLWSELLLLPAQMWRELTMNIWSRKPHIGMHVYAMTCTDTLILPWAHANHGFKGTGKRPSRCAELPPTCSSGNRKYGSLEWPSVPLCQRVPLTYIYHTPPVFLRSKPKRTDEGVENHKERKVGDWSRGEGNWTLVDEGRWRNRHNGRGQSTRNM